MNSGFIEVSTSQDEAKIGMIKAKATAAEILAEDFDSLLLATTNGHMLIAGRPEELLALAAFITSSVCDTLKSQIEATLESAKATKQ